MRTVRDTWWGVTDKQDKQDEAETRQRRKRLLQPRAHEAGNRGRDALTVSFLVDGSSLSLGPHGPRSLSEAFVC